MITMLPGMLTIVTLWALLYGVFMGVGLLTLRLCRVRAVTAELLLNAFWIGYGVVIGILQLWHLVLPVNAHALALISILGILGLALHFPAIQRSVADTVAHRAWMQWRFLLGFAIVGGLLCFAVWLANRAMGPIEPSDAGLYHLGAIKWVSSYPIVPGLGNLQHRFSNISSYFLFHSLLEAIPWQGRSYNLGAGLLLVATLAQISMSAWRVVCARSVSVADLMRLLYLAPIVRLCFSSGSSTTPDLPVFLLGMVISVELARMILGGRAASTASCATDRVDREFPSDPGQSREKHPLLGGAGVGSSLCLIALVSCVGVTTKLSFVVMGVLASGSAVWFAHAGGGRQMLRPAMGAALAGFLILAPWCGRNVILSGYPAYHSTALKVDVGWRVPEKVAKCESDFVRSWARKPKAEPAEVLANWDWFKPWLVGALGYWFLEMDVPLAMAAIGALILLYRAFNSRRDSARHLYISKVRSLWSVVGSLFRPVGMGLPDWGKSVVYLLIPLLSLGFWFWAAPAPRFAGAAFWWLGGGALVLAFLPPNGVPSSRGLSWGVLALSLILTCAFHFRADKFVSPGSERGFHPMPVVEMKPYTTIHGLNVLVPVEGDQCWDAPLPSSPYPNAGLKLRREGDLSGGFEVLNTVSVSSLREEK